MKELVMLRNAHAVVEDETGSASASTLHQRSALLRVQGLDLENEKLAANTKEQYTTYLKLFQVRILCFCTLLFRTMICILMMILICVFMCLCLLPPTSLQDFCNNTYACEEDLRYEVNEDKVLLFFKDVMFSRKIPKVFKPGNTKDIRMALALMPAESRSSRVRPVDLRKGNFHSVHVISSS